MIIINRITLKEQDSPLYAPEAYCVRNISIITGPILLLCIMGAALDGLQAEFLWEAGKSGIHIHFAGDNTLTDGMKQNSDQTLRTGR